MVIDKSLNIVDLEGLGFKVVTHAVARRVVKEIVTAISNHYPEMMGRLLIINAPKVFRIAWSFVKPMLDEKTITKISIYSTDKEAWVPALLELVDADQLPVLFGGKCKCDGKDPISCMMCVKGPWTQQEVNDILDSQPLEHIMTPQGARFLVEKRAAQAPAAEAAGSSSISAGPSAPHMESSTSSGLGPKE